MGGTGGNAGDPNTVHIPTYWHGGFGGIGGRGCNRYAPDNTNFESVVVGSMCCGNRGGWAGGGGGGSVNKQATNGLWTIPCSERGPGGDGVVRIAFYKAEYKPQYQRLGFSSFIPNNTPIGTTQFK